MTRANLFSQMLYMGVGAPQPGLRPLRSTTATPAKLCSKNMCEHHSKMRPALSTMIRPVHTAVLTAAGAVKGGGSLLCFIPETLFPLPCVQCKSCAWNIEISLPSFFPYNPFFYALLSFRKPDFSYSFAPYYSQAHQ